MRRLKVCMVNDLPFESPVSGGAEISIHQFQKKVSRHFDFVDTQQRSDLVVLNNIRSRSEEFLKRIQECKFVLYWRDALELPFDLELIQDLMEQALLNIALSPLHESRLKLHYGDAGEWFVAPPYMDLSKFNPEKRRDHRDNGNVLWAGKIYMHKGIEKLLLMARKSGFLVDFYGTGDPMLIGQIMHSAYGNYMGQRSHDTLTELYHEYRVFMHQPEQTEAFGRSVAEAYMAGCECVINDNVGFGSYFKDAWPYGDYEIPRKAIAESPEAVVEEILCRI